MYLRSRHRPILNTSSRERLGLTLIEVIVVCVVIGLLLALLLPAVQSARATARRIQCISNLRQLGIAETNYSSIHGMFTPDHLLTKRTWSTNRLSGFVFLLPYLEQPI